MSLVDDLERAGRAGAGLSGAGARPAAVMAAEGRHGRGFLVAVGGPQAYSYVILDDRERPVADPRRVRELVTLIALAERADEVAGAVDGERVATAFEDCAGRLREHGDLAAAGAAAGVAAAYRELVDAASGPRVATAAYLDRIGARAAAAAGALDGYAEHARRLGADTASDGADPIAAVAFEVLATAARAGDPGAFAASLGAGAGAVEALAGDVLAHYLVPLAAVAG